MDEEGLSRRLERMALLGHRRRQTTARACCVQLFEKLPNPVKDEPELHAYVTNFYVIPAVRSQGFENRLLDKALSWCRGQGARAIILGVTPGGRSLYRRCGFAEPADVLELRYAAHLPRSPVRRRS